MSEGTRRTYLGDAVYVELTNGMLRLYTSNGLQEIDQIFLEPAVLAQLFAYADMVWPQTGDEAIDPETGEVTADG